METLIERCCGLDVHQAVVVACLAIAQPGKKVSREIRSFPTTTAGLLELRDWLTAVDCTHVGMESTGVYWRPVHACWKMRSRSSLATPSGSTTCRAARPT